MAKNGKNRYTTAWGAPVADDQNSISAGERGPLLLQDVHLLQKLAHFNRERIPERVVHAKGAGAYGYFEVTNDVSKYTKAKFLSRVGKKTEMFARFSTVGGERGSADTARDPRGFALKFYTEDGNYDLVGNNTPVFFIRDTIKFPDFIHTQKRHPKSNLPDPDMFWDFLSLTPESIHQVTILFSDRGTPYSYRHMNGYSSHTYMWYNEKGDYHWVQFHFKTEQGIKNFNLHEAREMAGKDPNHATRDLYYTIEKGDYPSWKLEVQIMPPEDAKKYRFDAFDITKVWLHADYPPIEVGRMVLDKNPDNYFDDVEQAAFSPGNFVPGIGPSPDKMLQGRLFAYHDTHRHRLGPNYEQLPVNRARHAQTRTYQRDGFMRQNLDGDLYPNYYPNSFDGPEPDPSSIEPPIDVTGLAMRHKPSYPQDDFIQTGLLYGKVMTDTDRNHLVENIVDHLGDAQKRIQLRQCALFYKADPDYGTRVAEGIGLDAKEVKRLAEMSHEERAKATSA
ncbi:MAG: catalase [Deltaproteobacteria bacterium]|nr:MAG: catalase [Deltaproteobacteria bacterium]